MRKEKQKLNPIEIFMTLVSIGLVVGVIIGFISVIK